jgi:hypothetical protein
MLAFIEVVEIAYEVPEFSPIKPEYPEMFAPRPPSVLESTASSECAVPPMLSDEVAV